MMSQAPQLIVTISLIVLFGLAYAANPQDEMMKGAMIAGFAAAYGYWLGSSSGSKSSGDTIRKLVAHPTVTATGANPTINASGTEAALETEDPTMFGGPRP